ncbi:Manganese containing catalase [Saccharopolyspora kobensis]|uniref:Manganese containing catalase n=1 Tax=Saccharopolyspora kobensis TaxID=146035 RepID=A0A1H5VIM8_9PSEU|nr:Manganese containing catalase [Saccharopolyspora kobensis]SFC60381.1 Mn-containing catalase [Saccharopolyspora kobensis]
MFNHTKRLQFEARPENPDPVYAHKLQELIGGAWGEMTVTMQYLFQGWNCRIEGKYKDMIMDIATEEIGHVEMLATMVARLLEGAPSDKTAQAAENDPVLGAIIGGMDPQQAVVAGGAALPADANGYPWNGRYIIASGNLLADFRANVTAESQGRLQTARLYHMTDDPGVKSMLKFNLARVGRRNDAAEGEANRHRAVNRHLPRTRCRQPTRGNCARVWSPAGTTRTSTATTG